MPCIIFFFLFFFLLFIYFINSKTSLLGDAFSEVYLEITSEWCFIGVCLTIQLFIKGVVHALYFFFPFFFFYFFLSTQKLVMPSLIIWFNLTNFEPISNLILFCM
jgi:hypothetical protein